MPYLVEATAVFGDAHEAADALQAAFLHVTSALWTPASEEGPAGQASFDELRTRLSRRTVAVGAWTHPAGKLRVNSGQWDRGEVETNLRQIEVIILALRTAVFREATRVWVNPTQQAGADAEGEIGEERWVLEAYGGANVKNNRKLADDATALRAQPGAYRKFFACRPSAWPKKDPSRALAEGTFIPRGDPEQDGVSVFEFKVAD